MLSAEEKYYNKKKKSNKDKKEKYSKRSDHKENGQKPDITKIIAISNAKLKDYTNDKELDKKKTTQMQSGIESFILGTNSLKDRILIIAQSN